MKTNDTAVPFTDDMFPIVDSFASINSSAIEVTWHPSPNIKDIDLSQLPGAITIVLYANARIYLNTVTMDYPLTKLNETGNIVVSNLKSDTVHSVWYVIKWQDIVTVSSITVGLPSQLLRTYMEDQTTLNPIPSRGEYTWKQMNTDTGALAILVNASMSSQLPYNERNITIKLDSDTQSQILDSSSDVTEFQFNLTDPQRTKYLLTVIFKTYENITTLVFKGETIESTSKETITIIPRPTPTPSMGNRSYLCHSFFLVSFLIFILL